MKILKKMMIILYITSITNITFTQDENSKSGLGDTTCTIFLLFSGSWLANKQLPRLAGKKIEFDSPIFTKVGASLLFTIGISGGIVGAYRLAHIIRKNLNRI